MKQRDKALNEKRDEDVDKERKKPKRLSGIQSVSYPDNIMEQIVAINECI